MRVLELFISFLVIGLVGFGGGYSILKVMIHELVEVKGWISLDRFLDVSAISQSTPGPIALNAATFVGYTVGGVLGSLISTFAVVLGPFIISYFVGSYVLERRDNRIFCGMLIGLRPISVALVASAAISFIPFALGGLLQALMMLGSLFFLFRFKVDPIVLILLCGLLGLLLKL